MIRPYVAALPALLALTLSGGVQAQTRTAIEVTRGDIQADRKAILAANLPLSEAQATAFWPLYREYRSEMDVVGDRTVKLVTDYAASYDALIDDTASGLVTEHLAIQKDLVRIKTKYAPRFDKILPPKSVMRFYQLESKMDTILMMDLAAGIPLAK